jgi:hypothetical protein
VPNRSDGATLSVVKEPEPTKTRSPFDFPAATGSVEYMGVTYTFRELSVAENDLCREVATGPDDEFDGRAMIRHMIVTGATQPEMTMEDLEKVPQRLYAQFITCVNNLNDPETFKADPGNS